MATAMILRRTHGAGLFFRDRHTAVPFTLALACARPRSRWSSAVNGSVGAAGLAVAGTFALVRFPRRAGNGKEIVGLFLSMSIGLVCGMGYIYVAILYFVIMAAFVFSRLREIRRAQFQQPHGSR